MQNREILKPERVMESNLLDLHLKWARFVTKLSRDGQTMIDSGFRDVTGRIRTLLSESPMAEIRQLRVEQDGDRIKLEGNVRSFYAKQMAQETIRGATRGLHIVNSVCVD